MTVPRSLAVLIVPVLLVSGCGYQTSSDADPNSTDGHLLEKAKEEQGDDATSLVLELPVTWEGVTVQNGTAYDKAAVDLGGYKTVVVPHNVRIRTGVAGRKLEMFMAKTLKFGGFPSEDLDIREVRKKMGCMLKPEGNKLVVATYGEWDSGKEGGTTMKVLLVVPKGIQVEGRRGLRSRAWEGGYLTRPIDASKGYWCGPAAQVDTWMAVRAVPDSE